VLSVARAALKDAEWPVRRAAVEVLAGNTERPAARLLADAALREDAQVRGAALRALAERGDPAALALACRAVGEADGALIEDAYASLASWHRTRPAELRAVQQSCVPRAAAIIAFILEDSDVQ
jgi:HEAT repeat protein